MEKADYWEEILDFIRIFDDDNWAVNNLESWSHSKTKGALLQAIWSVNVTAIL